MQAPAPHPVESHAAVIGLWPTIKAFGEAVGVPGTLASVWKIRNNIPPERWAATAQAAAAIGRRDVTIEMLAATRRARGVA